MDVAGVLASCTSAVVRCDDTGTSGAGWHVVASVLVLVLLALLVGCAVRQRLRRPRPRRRPQRRVRVSAAGELLGVEEVRPSDGRA